jgi:hypothetical protein
VQPRARRGQLAEVGDDLFGDPLAREQRGHARRIAGDRLARDPPDRLVDGDRLPVAEERLADRDDRLVLLRGRRPGEQRALALPRQQSHRLGEIVREPLQQLDGLAEPEHQHQRGVRGELDVDVVADPKLGRELVSRAARAANVDHDPQRVPAGDPAPTHHGLADDRAAWNLADRDAGPRRGGERAVQQRLTVRRELPARAVKRRQQQRIGAGGAHEAHASRHFVGIDRAVTRDMEHG